MNLVNIQCAVAAILDGKATVADVIAASLKARITSWNGFGGWSDESGRSRTPSAAEVETFRSVADAFPRVERPALSSEQLDRLDAAERATVAEQARLDKAL